MRDYAIVDVFTVEALRGNPVAVFTGTEGLDAARMQQIARELNLSETTFLFPPSDGGDARLRIFTPVNELPFAGHPLLGSAFAVRARTGAERVVFETAMGAVPVAFTDPGDGGPVYGAMSQPVPTWEPYARAPELLDAVGAPAVLPVEGYRNGPRHVLVTVADVDVLAGLRPDHRALAEHEDMSALCLAGAGTEWTLRMFSPAYGVVEDAATGSAAGPVAIHLARHGLAPWDVPLTLHQGERIGRPCTMYARARAEAGAVRAVEVGGYAVVVGAGALDV